MTIAPGTAHQIVALGQKAEDLLGVIYAFFCVQNAYRDAVRFGQIQKFGSLAHVP